LIEFKKKNYLATLTLPSLLQKQRRFGLIKATKGNTLPTLPSKQRNPQEDFYTLQ